MTAPAFRTAVNFSGVYTGTSLPVYVGNTSLLLAVCGVFVPNFGSTVCVTTCSSDLTGITGYPGLTFESLNGVTASKVESLDGIRTANMEATLLLANAGFTEADILAGKWTRASATIFLLNFEIPTMGQIILQTGYLSTFVQIDGVFKTEIRGINNSLNSNIVKLVRPECDAVFGDARCGLDLTALGFVKTGTVTTGSSQTLFTDTGRTEVTASADYFTNGVLTWNTGLNANYTFEIDSYNETTKQFILRRPTPYTITIGDTYTATRGDQKRFHEDCVLKFNNAQNFRGFPDLPGLEAISKLPDQ